MSAFTITHKIEASSVQKATALRDKCAEYLKADADVKVVGSAMSPVSHRFKVVGVDITGKEPFAEDVEADSADAARAKVASKTRVVAEVRVQV